MPALFLFLLLLIGEIALFMRIGEEIGTSGVLLWILVTAVCGMILIRAQGQHMIQQARTAMESRQQPVGDALVAMCAILGGVLLIVPGFITDGIGLAFALPGLRNVTSGWVQKGMGQQPANDQPFPGQNQQAPPHQQRPGSPPVIDGEFSVVEDEPKGDGQSDTSPEAGSGSVPPYREDR